MCLLSHVWLKNLGFFGESDLQLSGAGHYSLAVEIRGSVSCWRKCDIPWKVGDDQGCR